jgi:hypothetical protein
MRWKWSWLNLRQSGAEKDHDKYEDTVVGVTTEIQVAIIRKDVTIITDLSDLLFQKEILHKLTLRISETGKKTVC